MPKWMTYLGDPNLVLKDDDLAKAAPIIAGAEALWKRHYRDQGPVVIGAGVGVLYLPPRCRNPRDRLIIESPGQGDGMNTIQLPINYLARHGIAGFIIYGRRD